jgi:hypothetical protein
MRSGQRRWYAGVLDIPEGKSGRFRIRHILKPAGATIESGTLRTALFGQKSESLHFDEPTRWHELYEKGQGQWMTDLPIEQRQADALVRHATGRVLVGGLGLGYAVVALAAKKRVKEIVVVERSPHVIKLVWDATVQAVRKTSQLVKLSVVEADLFHYLEGQKNVSSTNRGPGVGEPFNWALYDIWQSDGESTFHETVVPLRRLSEGLVRRVECWNEDIMRNQLYQGLNMRMLLLRASKELEARPPDGSNRLTLDINQLCRLRKSHYTDWAVPFWEWYRDNAEGLDQDMVDWVASRYTLSYGRPERNDGLVLLDNSRSYVRRIRDAAGSSIQAG